MTKIRLQKGLIKYDNFVVTHFNLIIIEVQLFMFKVNMLNMSYLLSFVVLAYCSIPGLLGFISVTHKHTHTHTYTHTCTHPYTHTYTHTQTHTHINMCICQKFYSRDPMSNFKMFSAINKLRSQVLNHLLNLKFSQPNK